MKSVRVHLKDRSYDICFGRLGSRLPLTVKKLGLNPSKILVVTSPALKKAGHLNPVVAGFKRAGFDAASLLVRDGEANKNFRTLEKLYADALKMGLDRKSVVVAVGGGVVTDMVGFFAATYMRGISFISVPTTLLGMVDAAIGGKTGVDLPAGKNLVGAFWQPKLVWIDTAVLKTLPPREWVTGFAEIIKYGVIKEGKFFTWLESRVRRNPRASTWSEKELLKAVFDSARMKAAVVSGDEKEAPLKGGREILNFGHTAGHALEAATGYNRWSHGQAISVGMVVAGRIAMELNLWSKGDQLRLIELLLAFGLPVHFPTLSSAQKKIFWSALRKDKKHVAGSLRFVLPERFGRVQVRSGIPAALVQKACRDAGL